MKRGPTWPSCEYGSAMYPTGYLLKQWHIYMWITEFKIYPGESDISSGIELSIENLTIFVSKMGNNDNMGINQNIESSQQHQLGKHLCF